MARPHKVVAGDAGRAPLGTHMLAPGPGGASRERPRKLCHSTQTSASGCPGGSGGPTWESGPEGPVLSASRPPVCLDRVLRNKPQGAHSPLLPWGCP